VYHDLLHVQEHDTTADQLRHRRQNLPELVQLAAVEEELVRLGADLTATTDAAVEATRSQRRREGELTGVDILRSRRATVEDEVLDAMGAREALDEEIAALRRRQSSLDDDGARLRAAVAEAQTQLDRDLAAEVAAREATAAEVPGDLIVLYEQLRARLGGVAAALLVNRRCGGCHLALPATEVARLRKASPSELVRCEQCERILVRP